MIPPVNPTQESVDRMRIEVKPPKEYLEYGNVNHDADVHYFESLMEEKPVRSESGQSLVNPDLPLNETSTEPAQQPLTIEQQRSCFYFH